VGDPRHHTVQVPATTANLGPGYDAFGLALDRYLAVRTLPRGHQAERVTTAGPGADDLACGDDNLVWRAFVTFCDLHGVATPDVAMQARTSVPLERGLGSSSSAIVAGLVLARALTGVAVGDRDLVETASDLEGHPDNVAPALLGGLVACASADDGDLVVRRINPAAHLRPYALVPSARQATTAARSVVPDHLSRDEVAEQAARAGHVLAVLTGAWPADVRVVGDRLHEPPRLAVMGPSGDVVDALRSAGVHAWLSGAGPSVAAVVPAGAADPHDAIASIADEHDFALCALSFDLSGAVACPDDGCAFAGTPGCVQCPRRRV
jgi:homoserine kinase